MIDNHHLLECILWPNGDGSFRKIINTQKRLEKLGIYDDYKLTIPIERSIHQTMHNEFKRGTEYSREGENNPMYGNGTLISGNKNGRFGKGYLVANDKNPMFGRTGEKAPMFGRRGEDCPMYGRTGALSPNWKGEDVGPIGLYKRALKRYKMGEISNEEFQKFRDLKSKHIKERRHNKCQQ